ncbi:MAG: PD-(D/E)XK nuclease family protein [Lysobacter sp.]|nr:PD-(D/E)XK nuclease family protein [Lysobacter sp.]
MQSPFASIARDALFERLARGHAGGLAILTPNRRLASALARDYDDSRAAAGLAAWESADILPWASFVERLWDEALHAPGTGEQPLLLAPDEEAAIWEAVVADSRQAKDVFSAASTARLCREAWKLVHAWRLRPAREDANEDAMAFAEWSSRYERRTREGRFVDAARLPDALAPLLRDEGLTRPATLVLYAFDLITPQMRDLLEAAAGSGAEVLSCGPPRHKAVPVRLPLASPAEEIAAAARWARARLEAAESRGAAVRIGVVVPDLAQSRRVVERVFAATLHPGFNAPGGRTPPRAFELSLGRPLSDYAIVRDALLLLQLSGREIAFNDASRLLRSPFLAEGESEMAVRARLDAELRRRSGVTLTLDRLVDHLGTPRMPRAPVLANRLAQLAKFRRSDLFAARTPAQWARAFAEALRVVGFPGERSLDSVEFQVLGKWHETLAAFARLERVTGKIGFRDALGGLSRLATDTLFQPESPDVPVQVMGVLESAGLGFDHLWVLGLDDGAWPLPARPNPFLPIRAQRAAGVPEADAGSSLELDRRITGGWMCAAAEVIFSHPLARGEAETSPSPLIAVISPAGPDVQGRVPAFSSWRDAIHAAPSVEHIADERGPELAGGAATGGTAIFRDQAACPFRAFSAHRLGSSAPEVPQPGLTPADRGSLLHAVLAAAWERLGDKGTLDSLGAGDLEEILTGAADAALERARRRRPDTLAGRFAALERARLVSTALAWLEYERGRGDFEVAATERKVTVEFGGISANVKLDRMDRLAAGGCAVIDYKTGEARVGAWLGERPDEPQLPMYALGTGEDVAVLAFARVKPGENAFKGLAREENLLPGTTLVSKDRSRLAAGYADWSQLREGWRRELDALGRAFAAGDARIDPKYGSNTCAGCAERLVCRVAESGLREGEDEGATDE